MEIKLNPYLSISHIENNKGKIFDNKKNKNIKGKIIEVKEGRDFDTTILLIEVNQKKENLAYLLGEVVTIHL
jgi:hypothetical protein